MNKASDFISVVSNSPEVLPERSDHVLSAVYPSRQEADGVLMLLVAQGIASSEVRIFHQTPEPVTDAGSDEVLKDVLVDGGVGTLLGAGVGAVGTLAIVASGLTLFVASPVVAPLAMLGWFAGLGGIVGAAVGAGRRLSPFSDLVKDAVQAGNTVLVVHTHNPADQTRVRDILERSFRGRDETTTESSFRDVVV